MRVIVALPAYNEEQAIAPLLSAMERDLSGLDYQVLLVDDGSTDDTASVACSFAGSVPVEVVAHPRNLGLAAAVRTALAHAVSRASAFDWVVTMDADNTHPPSIIRSMPLADDFNLCIVSRFVPGAEVHGVPRGRAALSEVASRLLRAMFPAPGIRDYSSGYRAYRGDLLGAAVGRYGERLVQSRGFAVQVELVLKLRPLGIRGTEVPIDLHYERKPTASKARMAHTVLDLMGVMARALWAGRPGPRGG